MKSGTCTSCDPVSESHSGSSVCMKPSDPDGRCVLMSAPGDVKEVFPTHAGVGPAAAEAAFGHSDTTGTHTSPPGPVHSDWSLFSVYPGSRHSQSRGTTPASTNPATAANITDIVCVRVRCVRCLVKRHEIYLQCVDVCCQVAW